MEFQAVDNILGVDDASFFYVNPDTGDITVAKDLSGETQTLYSVRNGLLYLQSFFFTSNVSSNIGAHFSHSKSCSQLSL